MRVWLLVLLLSVFIVSGMVLAQEKCLTFIGTPWPGTDGNYVRVPQNALVQNLSSMTVEFWYYHISGSAGDPWGEQQQIVATEYPEGTGWGIKINNGLLDCSLQSLVISSSDITYSTNQWQHIAMVYDNASNSNQLRLYVNGVLKGNASGQLTSLGSPTRDIVINRQHWFSGSPPLYSSRITAKIEELRISNTARYSSSFTPPTSNFITDANTLVLYHFNEGNGSSIIDASGNGINGTINGNMTWSNDTPIINSLFNVLLTSPAGEENWQTNSQHNITWSSSGVDNVKLEYTTDNGTNWSTIIASTTASAGSYAWTVPNTPSTQCKIRVLDASNASVGDTSNAVFSIAPLTLTDGLVAYYPFNGNANDESGNFNNGTVSGASLTSDRNGNSNQAYSFNGSNNYISIPDNSSFRPVNLTVSAWVFGYDFSSNRQILAKNAGSGAYESIDMLINNSGYNFMGNIGGPSSWGTWLQSPNPISVNQWHHLVYTFDDVSNLQKQYIDGVLVNSGTEATSIIYDSKPWTIGAEYENNIMSWFFSGKIDDIRIYDRVLSDSEVLSLFGVNAQITLSSPSSGDILHPNTNQNITWASSGVTNLKLEYSTDTGTNWSTIISSTSASPGSYSWTVPNTLSTQCKVRITDVSNATIGDTSDAVFAIAAFTLTDGLVAYYPFNGNANDESGNSHNGTVNGASLTTDRFGETGKAYSLNGVNNFISLGSWFNFNDFTVSIWVEADVQAGHAALLDNGHSGSYNWVCQAITQFASNGYEFGGVPTFYLPTGSWAHLVLQSSGTTKKVFVNGQLAGEASASINYALTPNLNFGYWAHDNARYWKGLLDNIRIYNRALSETEINTLYHENGWKNISVTSPNGGERWQSSNTYNITWSAAGLNYVNLEYTSNNGTTWSSIENNVSASSGLYYWSVPNSAGTNFKVRITSSSDATITAMSNATFAVYKSVSVLGASPYYYYPMNATSDDIVSGNNGTMSGVTSATDRFETSSGTVSLSTTSSSIELPDKFFFGADKTAHSFSFWFYPTSTEGLIWGKSGNLQSTALQMLTGGQLYFQWAHPAPGSPSTTVYSDATTAAGVISQNAWNHVAVNYANSLVTFYINGQAVSTANRTLDNSHSVTDNTKTYSLIDWGQTVGGSANGKNGFGSVSDPTLSNGSFTGKLDEVKIYDTSLTASLIRQLYSLDVIKLTAFNAGGDFVPGVSYAITWKSLQTSTLKLEYSTDGGTNWTSISTGVIASLGTYAWTIPYAPSTNCKLRITDETDALKYAVSTSSFTIINQQPSVSSMKTAASTGSNSIKFGDALVTVEGFWKALFPVTVTYYPGTAPPNSTIPSGFVRLSNYYWNVNVPGNTINSGGAISCSVIDLPGVVNPLTVKWLRRMSESDPWINLGSNYATGTLKSAVSFTNFGEFALGTTNAENPLPVELSSFRAQIIKHAVRFTWETATEITNSEYRLERTKAPLKYDKDGKVLHYWGAWVAVQKLKGAGTSYSPKTYTAYDRSVIENGVYGYRLLQVDYDGKENLVTETEVDLDFTPTTFVLEQNYPNPFNPSTTIKYGLPVNSHITINIYNSLGQLITKVADEVQTAGYHTAVWNGSNFASGIYFYELKAEGFKTVKKLMLVK